MSIIDHRGRVFGRFNLVDFAIVAFLFALIPVAYGVVRLFQPSRPRIDSVSPAAVSKEEWRIAGSAVGAKLKVKGSGFNPMLRATIGGTDALAFVFESPNSADVIVGRLPPGRHDLKLLDGVQVVATSSDAVTIPTEEGGESLLLEGWLTGLDSGVASALNIGDAFPKPSPVIEILALGPARPGRSRLNITGGSVDLPLDGRMERQIVVRARCDSTSQDDPCRVLGQSVAALVDPALSTRQSSERSLTVPGPSGVVHLTITDVFPSAAPRTARALVRLAGGPELALVAVGDRDSMLDQRAAVVTAVGSRESAGSSRSLTVTLTLGLDDSREGWRYRGRLVAPGQPLRVATGRYAAGGMVQSVELVEATPSRTR